MAPRFGSYAIPTASRADGRTAGASNVQLGPDPENAHVSLLKPGQAAVMRQPPNRMVALTAGWGSAAKEARLSPGGQEGEHVGATGIHPAEPNSQVSFRSAPPAPAPPYRTRGPEPFADGANIASDLGAGALDSAPL
jgi:hypothetical protein